MRGSVPSVRQSIRARRAQCLANQAPAASGSRVGDGEVPGRGGVWCPLPVGTTHASCGRSPSLSRRASGTPPARCLCSAR
jgi:hypothetical protein